MFFYVRKKNRLAYIEYMEEQERKDGFNICLI